MERQGKCPSEAEVTKLTKKEFREYEDSLKAYLDIKNPIGTANRSCPATDVL